MLLKSGYDPLHIERDLARERWDKTHLEVSQTLASFTDPKSGWKIRRQDHIVRQ